jgi:Na+/citrate or Na+/malate symporter
VCVRACLLVTLIDACVVIVMGFAAVLEVFAIDAAIVASVCARAFGGGGGVALV